MKLIKCMFVFTLITILTTGCCTGSNDNNDCVESLNERKVVKELSRAGINLKKSDMDTQGKYTLAGIKPSIYEIKKLSNNYVFIYVFDTLGDRKKAQMTARSDHILNDLKMDYFIFNPCTAKNVLILHVPYKKDLEEMKLAGRIRKVVFKKLNPAKQMLFTGEGENWEAIHKVVYYEYFMHEKGKLDYDHEAWKNTQIIYKKQDLDSVGEVNYTLKTLLSKSSGTRNTLDDDGAIKFISGGSVPRDNEEITVTVEWQNKSETFTLKAKE